MDLSQVQGLKEASTEFNSYFGGKGHRNKIWTGWVISDWWHASRGIKSTPSMNGIDTADFYYSMSLATFSPPPLESIKKSGWVEEGLCLS